MHAPTFAQFLIGAMAASSALAFQVANFARVGTALALVAAGANPGMALPAPVPEEASVEKRHHKGKRTGGGRNRNNARDVEEIEKRHHKGKRTGGGGRNKNNARDVENDDAEDHDVEARDVEEIEKRHHKGKRTGGGGRNRNNARDVEDDDVEDHDIEARDVEEIEKRHHKGKRTGGGGRNRNQRRQTPADGSDDEFSDGDLSDADDGAVAKRSLDIMKRHHKGKRTGGGRNKNQRRQNGNATDSDNGFTSNDDNGLTSGDDDGFSSDDGAARAARSSTRAPAGAKMRRDPSLGLNNIEARHHKGKRTGGGRNRGGN